MILLEKKGNNSGENRFQAIFFGLYRQWKENKCHFFLKKKGKEKNYV